MGVLAATLRELCAQGVEAVFTTGGTGVAPRDVTPEATRKVISREVPGLAEQMRREGVKTSPTAALSRGVAGVSGRTLIINLPGSPQGATDSLKAVLSILPHAVELLAGEDPHPQ
jgi:molybdenum cofactor synthesis domain-containing protein